MVSGGVCRRTKYIVVRRKKRKENRSGVPQSPQEHTLRNRLSTEERGRRKGEKEKDGDVEGVRD